MTEKETQTVLDAMKTRRSIRRYKPDAVPQELIDKIVEAGTFAASGHGEQPWLVVQLTDPATRDRLRRANARVMGQSEDADPFYGAPVWLIVLAERANTNHVCDGALMMGNMMLAAHALGLGSCWINRAREEFDMPEWKEWLRSIGIEGDYEGVAHLALGYPASFPHTVKPRKACFVKA